MEVKEEEKMAGSEVSIDRQEFRAGWQPWEASVNCFCPEFQGRRQATGG